MRRPRVAARVDHIDEASIRTMSAASPNSPVVTEALWLLPRDPEASAGPFRAFVTRLLALMPVDDAGLPWLEAFRRRYARIALGLADATLVHLAEREGADTVFPLDQRDFSDYRLARKRRL